MSKINSITRKDGVVLAVGDKLTHEHTGTKEYIITSFTFISKEDVRIHYDNTNAFLRPHKVTKIG